MLASPILRDMFWLAIPIAEKIFRPILVYFSLVILLRIFGKRELAQLNPFDLVVLLSLSNTVQNAIIGEDNSVTGGLVGAFTLLCVNYLVVRFVFKRRRLDQLLEGKPTQLIERGKICPRGMSKEMLSKSELLTVAHRQGFSNLSEVETCVLEPGGTFFMKGKEPRPEERKHSELVARLDQLNRQVEALRQQVSSHQA